MNEEKGFFKFDNVLAEKLALTEGLTPADYKTLFLIARNTYGFHVDRNEFSYGYIEINIGVSRATAKRVIKNLLDKKIIKKYTSGVGAIKQILGINENTEEWEGVVIYEPTKTTKNKKVGSSMSTQCGHIRAHRGVTSDHTVGSYMNPNKDIYKDKEKEKKKDSPSGQSVLSISSFLSSVNDDVLKKYFEDKYSFIENNLDNAARFESCTKNIKGVVTDFLENYFNYISLDQDNKDRIKNDKRKYWNECDSPEQQIIDIVFNIYWNDWKNIEDEFAYRQYSDQIENLASRFEALVYSLKPSTHIEPSTQARPTENTGKSENKKCLFWKEKDYADIKRFKEDITGSDWIQDEEEYRKWESKYNSNKNKPVFISPFGEGSMG